MSRAPAAAPGADADAAARRRGALLAVCDSGHLPRLRDVDDVGGVCALDEEAPAGPTLAALLERRGALGRAEAVTVALGVARGVAAVHAAGFCRLDLAAAQVSFDGRGAPVLTGLDEVRPVLAAGADGTAGDWRAFLLLLNTLGLAGLGRHVDALAGAVSAVAAHETPQSLTELDDTLFDTAEPAAVAFDGPRGAVRGEPAARRTAQHRRPSSSRLLEAFDAGPRALLAAPRERMRRAAGGLAARLSGRGRLMLVAGGVMAALTVAAVLLLPGTDRGAPHGPVPRPAASAVAVPRPPVGTAQPRAASSATASPSRMLRGDDPVAAAAVLLAARDACLLAPPSELSTCLREVVDGDPGQLAAPRRPLAGARLSLIERTGGSALVALTPPKGAQTPPASVLLMRTEAGWRLRRLFENAG